MERSQMESSSKSAGMPGAPSCSEGQQATIPTKVVVDLFSGVCAELSEALDLIYEGIEEPDGAALTGAAALIRNAGAAIDRAVGALGGSPYNSQDGWLLSPVAAQALARIEGREAQDGRESEPRLSLDPEFFDHMDESTLEWAVRFDALAPELKAKWSELVETKGAQA